VSVLAPPLSARNETQLERCDRHLAELMQEIRVTQTGVQVLFAFLLTVAFTDRFHALSAAQRDLYFASLAAAGAAAMLLITPGAQHRVLFRCGDKEHIVRLANRYAIAGMACAALAMAGSLTFVADVLFGSVSAGLVGGLAAAGCLWCWYIQPLLRRRTLYRRAAAQEHVQQTAPG
jgi:nucleotide-binding universal stress UspA family protein